MEHELNKGKSQGKDMNDEDKKATKVGGSCKWFVLAFIFLFMF